MMNNATELSVIIVNHNGGKVLSDCVSSVLNHFNGFKFEVLVYDNNSSDDSLSLLPGDKRISVLEGRTNLGFGSANNAAFKESAGRYILLLNNDARFIDASFNLIFDYIKENAGIVASLLDRYSSE